MSDSPLTEFIAVAALFGLLGVGVLCYQQSAEIDSLKKLTNEQAIKLETMERTLLMSR